MQTETKAIITAALKLDATLTDKQRREIGQRITQPSDKVRVRIPSSRAREILGLSRTTFHRRRADDPAYKALDSKKDGETTFFYLDEIESLRDGVLSR